MRPTIFLKLGGSLITDKMGIEEVRPLVLLRLAHELADVYEQNPNISLVLGHGSGSFGHVAAARYGTREGITTRDGWRGFVVVQSAASRLNQLVLDALGQVEVPAMPFPPSASAICEDGRLIGLAIEPIKHALAGGVIPIVYGDVAIDRIRGGTIVSTEEVMVQLVEELQADYLFLAGETAGVLDEDGAVIPLITEANFAQIRPLISGSAGVDVTGGMLSKVEEMLRLVKKYPHISIRIFSGLQMGNVSQLLLFPAHSGIGTLIRAC